MGKGGTFGLALCLGLTLATAGCKDVPDRGSRPPSADRFPQALRPVSQPEGNAFSTEPVRDARREAAIVMDLARIEPGMSVADLGAGNGYYTVRLAERVGPKGRVLAQDIAADALKQLGTRVEHDRLDNVSIKLGAQDDPRLPQNSFDRILLVHMYHEVSEPYAFLWRLRPALRENGRVVVVDADRPSDQHGLPPAMLFCEFRSVGFRLTEFVRKPEFGGYYAAFEAQGKRPQPAEIVPCEEEQAPPSTGPAR